MIEKEQVETDLKKTKKIHERTVCCRKGTSGKTSGDRMGRGSKAKRSR